MKTSKKFLALILLCFIFTSNLFAITVNNKIIVPNPELKWNLTINGVGFAPKEENYTQENNSINILGSYPEKEINLSAFIEKKQFKSVKQVRDFYWKNVKKSPLKISKIKKSSEQDREIVEYLTTTKYMGQDLIMKNYNIYLLKDDYAIDVHLSSINVDSIFAANSEIKGIFEEKVDFKSIINSIQIEPIQSDYSLWDNFKIGIWYYSKQLFPVSIFYLERTLELYKKDEKSLTTKGLKELILSLAGSYLPITRQVDKSMEILQFGIQKVKSPRFYFQIAYLHFIQKEYGKELENLTLMFENEKNLEQDEVMPPLNQKFIIASMVDKKFYEGFLELKKKYSKYFSDLK